MAGFLNYLARREIFLLVVEHSFVTTLEFAQVYEMISSLMRRMGFAMTTECTHCGYDLRGTISNEGARCPECGSSQAMHTRSETMASVIVATRGKEKAGTARKTEDLPQRVRVEFDRGRVNIAASLTPKAKVLPHHRTMMLAIVNAIEAVVGRNEDAKPYVEDWSNLRSEGDAYDRKQRQKRATGCALLVVLFVAIIGLLIALAASGR